MRWLLAQDWLRPLAGIAAAVLAALLFLIGLRRAGEKTGALEERLRHVQCVERARARMSEVPRPDGRDVSRRLRDGSF